MRTASGLADPHRGHGARRLTRTSRRSPAYFGSPRHLTATALTRRRSSCAVSRSKA